eukprot:CAMPEP_0196724070 /NCGR_PEP_ID=MMETSP1091-20130531/6086_1 /TAXON_ID=302021 /ORGANISM="Rhodomonas sp., Strain CCMP768" /LENGTH=482 /DNA_ID=CAMNT_0042066161 /DNA_START=49 /DNA_END=1498 /DNA_ORIENTATION=+
MEDSEIQKYDQYVVKLVFDMYHKDIAGREAAFAISVRESICLALDLQAKYVLPQDVHDGATSANLTLNFVMFGPDIKSYITRLYDQISNPSSVLRQHTYTRRTITAEVSKKCQKDECVEATKLISERDTSNEDAVHAFQEFVKMHAECEGTRQKALEAEKSVSLLSVELQTMERQVEELKQMNDDATTRAAEADLAEFKRNLREQVDLATKTASYARALMEDVAKARQETELKAAACTEASRRWSRACYRAISACDSCTWAQDLRRHEAGLYRYQCPNRDCGFVSGFFDMCNHFSKCRIESRNDSPLPGAGGITVLEEEKKNVEGEIRALLQQKTVDFIQNEPTLTEAGQKTTDGIAELLLKLPQGCTVEVHGHTQCGPEGKIGVHTKDNCTNMRLANNRCQAVIKRIQDFGVRASFQPVAWACLEPTVGSRRMVRIFIKYRTHDTLPASTQHMVGAESSGGGVGAVGASEEEVVVETERQF